MGETPLHTLPTEAWAELSGINLRTDIVTGLLELFGQPTIFFPRTFATYNFSVCINNLKVRAFSITFIPGVGDVSTRAAWSCLHVAKVYAVSVSDVRWINPSSPFQAFCDQSDGLGGMKFLQICEFGSVPVAILPFMYMIFIILI